MMTNGALRKKPDPRRQVDEWLVEARKQGIQTILCLLPVEGLNGCASLPGGPESAQDVLLWRGRGAAPLSAMPLASGGGLP
jgi:hypothetical protein